jgi:trans-aconitate 2-methyltransferase
MYQWNAADYANHSQGQERWAQELLAGIELRTDEAVLDIGCGDGRTTAAIAQRVPNGTVLGVDLSADMVQHASDRFCDIHNLAFQQADASALPFDSQFTLVYSNATLHWVRDHRPVLGGISRALKVGGRVLAQMGGAGNGASVIAAFNEVAVRETWREYFVGFVSSYGFHHPDEYQQWLRQAGLNASMCKLIPKDMVHANVAEFTAWLRTAWHPYTAPVPGAQRAAFIAETASAYIASHPADDLGRVQVPMMRLEVHAVKA